MVQVAADAWGHAARGPTRERLTAGGTLIRRLAPVPSEGTAPRPAYKIPKPHSAVATFPETTAIIVGFSPSVSRRSP